MAWDLPRLHYAIEQLLDWDALEPDEGRNCWIAGTVGAPDYGYFTITPRGRELLQDWEVS